MDLSPNEFIDYIFEFIFCWRKFIEKLVISALQKDSEFICFIWIKWCLHFNEYNIKPMFSNQFHIIASIEKNVHTLFWLVLEKVYLLCNWFHNKFKDSKKISWCIQFDSTIVFQSNRIQKFNSYHIIFLYLFIAITIYL